VDTTPPELTLSASPSELWPPNHRLVPIAVTVTTSDVCDENPDVRLVSITSNEGTLANGSGHTSPDVEGAAFGSDDRAFLLRAERRGPGNGRVYTITYEAEDGSGNVTTRTVAVTVAKSQGGP
jgi:endo-1,4-beta-xylanase